MREVPSGSRKPRRRVAGLTLFLLAILALALVAVPMWLIQPFSPQTPEGLSVAYALRRWAPLGTALALAAGLLLAFRLWRGSRWWGRAALVLALVSLAGATWLARQNIFEKMFASIQNARFVPAAEASWVEEGDAVMAVERNGEAAAYPVRQLAYHHIVQDEVGGVPIVATY